MPDMRWQRDRAEVKAAPVADAMDSERSTGNRRTPATGEVVETYYCAGGVAAGGVVGAAPGTSASVVG
jgi:hypothetical protein